MNWPVQGGDKSPHSKSGSGIPEVRDSPQRLNSGALRLSAPQEFTQFLDQIICRKWLWQE